MGNETKLTESQLEFAFKNAVAAAVNAAPTHCAKAAANAVAEAALAAAATLNGKKA